MMKLNSEDQKFLSGTVLSIRQGLVPKLVRWMVPLLVLVYLLSGFYMVKTDELGVVRRFGRITTPEGILPGIHYRLPFPIDRVNTPKTTKVKKIVVGAPSRAGKRKRARGNEMAEVLVGDTNILNVKMNVQYLIGNPTDYLFRSKDPDRLVTVLAESVLIEILGKMGVDYVLTVGKIKIQEKTKKKIQELLDSYRVGVKVIAVNLQSVEPPAEVIEAFNDVSSAKTDRERLINEALGRKGALLPKTRGEAHKIREAAKGYALERINAAQGETESFLSILKEYRKYKDVTRTRIYIETMEMILPKIRKYIVDPNPQTPVDLGFLGQDQ